MVVVGDMAFTTPLVLAFKLLCKKYIFNCTENSSNCA